MIKDANVSNNPGPYNVFFGTGGAIVCDNSTSLIERCIIKGNKALVMTKDTLGGVGAGLSFASSDVTLNDTLIEGNEALYVSAIDVGPDSNVTINRCTIAENKALGVQHHGTYAKGDVAGIGIAIGSEVIMDDVSISNNQAADEYAAITNGEH